MGRAANATPKERRENFPADVFCGPGRTFPIEDVGDIHSAARLIGKADNQSSIIACIIRKAKGIDGGAAAVPDSWKTAHNSNSDAVAMSERDRDYMDRTGRLLFALGDAPLRAEGTHNIYAMSLLFRPGDYPDKAFNMSPEEIYAAVQNFQGPVTGNIEHTDFLKGRACEVRRVWMSESDNALMGEVAVPIWLDANLEPQERRLSAELPRDSKTLSGLALVCNPRVPDAALMQAAASFSKEDLDAYARFAGPNAVQTMHDMAVAHGATCSSNAAKLAMAHDEVVQKFHDVAVAHGAKCVPMTAAVSGQSPQGGTGMAEERTQTAFFEGLGNWFKTGNWTASPTPPAILPAATAGADPEIVKLQAEVATERGKRLTAEATAFADEMVRTVAMAAERPAIIASYLQAATDDLNAPATVKFTNAQGQEATGSRLDALRAAFALRPTHNLFHEAIRPNGGATVLPPAGGANPAQVIDPRTGAVKMSEERFKELAGATQMTTELLLANGKNGS